MERSREEQENLNTVLQLQDYLQGHLESLYTNCNCIQNYVVLMFT